VAITAVAAVAAAESGGVSVDNFAPEGVVGVDGDDVDVAVALAKLDPPVVPRGVLPATGVVAVLPDKVFDVGAAGVAGSIDRGRVNEGTLAPTPLPVGPVGVIPPLALGVVGVDPLPPPDDDDDANDVGVVEPDRGVVGVAVSMV
jgi:hypothetical protein